MAVPACLSVWLSGVFLPGSVRPHFRADGIWALQQPRGCRVLLLPLLLSPSAPSGSLLLPVLAVRVVFWSHMQQDFPTSRLQETLLTGQGIITALSIPRAPWRLEAVPFSANLRHCRDESPSFSCCDDQWPPQDLLQMCLEKQLRHLALGEDHHVFGCLWEEPGLGFAVVLCGVLLSQSVQAVGTMTAAGEWAFFWHWCLSPTIFPSLVVSSSVILPLLSLAFYLRQGFCDWQRSDQISAVARDYCIQLIISTT